jgi:TAT (twin-arginine translocation) pathway signal sequence
MSGFSRRSFLHASAAAGAAAVVGMPAIRAVATSSNTQADAHSDTDSTATSTGTFVVFVKDARKGQISVMNGENETVTNDPDLVRRIVRAAKA